MITSNYHIHTTYCDGKNTAVEMAKAAYDAGLTDIGFSGHAPLKYPDDWTMPEKDLPDYLADVRKLKQDYAGKMNIACGLEMDYYMDTQALSVLEKKVLPKLDYWIGSIHCIGEAGDGEVCYFDDTVDSMAHGIDKIFDGDVRATVEAYYNSVATMAKTTHPDIIGHMDLIKKTNEANRFFDETAAYYVDAWHDALDVINKTDCIIEINTGGVYRYGKRLLYPSEAMIDEILAKHIPITVNGDSHETAAIDFGLNTFVKDLLEAKGVKSIMVLTDSGWAARAF